MARYGIRLWDFFVTNTKSYFWSLHTLGKLFVTNAQRLLWGLHILGKFKVINSGAAVVRERSIWLLSQNALPPPPASQTSRVHLSDKYLLIPHICHFFYTGKIFGE